MTKAQLFMFGSAVLTAVISDLITYLQSRRRALDEDRELPAYQWERLAEKILAGVLVGLGGAGVSTL